METKSRFQNFAKLKDTEIAFNDITVLAGKPGTGKSYVMKFMYAVDEANYLIQNILHDKAFEKIDSKIDSKKNKEWIYLEKEHFGIFDEIRLSRANDEFYETSKGQLKNLLNSIFYDINQISNNFIVNIEHYELLIQYDGNFRDDIKIYDFDINAPSTVIFVETPLILEFKKFMKREKGKTPYHIESLLNILDTDYSFTDNEQDKFIKDFTQKSKKIIKGDIKSSGDSFIFNQEGGQNYDILNASSGTKSIGLLQYLVTNKALKKGSVLYWEEPEVHLHPEWQLRMIELFIELMNAGIKIVFSTHSPYMGDYLNALSKRQGFRDRISFNVLDEKDGIVTNHILNDDNWDILQKELMDTFEDILWQYLSRKLFYY